jgi:predicted ABC-type transport system involved in lysophospholipase L1 biosynthesis ATPase subunit
LVVPVTALVAQASGGYSVEVVGNTGRGANRLVPVSLGLFDDADGLVQVTGPGLAVGQEVVVPST